MQAKTAFRKFLWFIFTSGATLSMGFLSFAGMYVIAPSFLLCGGAFILAAAYEGQVNGEGIAGALKRMFDPNYLKLGVVSRYLNELIEKLTKENKTTENLFLKDYLAQQKHIKALEKYISDLEKKSKSYLQRSQEYKDAHKKVHEQEAELEKAKERSRNMRLFFLKNLYSPVVDSPNRLEAAVSDLIGDKAETLKKEIKRKAVLMKASWVLSFAVGACSGLASLSAMQAGIATFAVLSAVPGGAIIALAALAAIGYTLLIYQGVSDMIQDYNSGWTGYFKRRTEESRGMHALRCTLVVAAMLLGVAATLATAGTWYKLVKDGAQILGAIDQVANVLRDVFISMILLPNLLFYAQNSVESVDNICKSEYKKLFSDAWAGIDWAWKKENFIRFLNPFRFVEKIISYTGKTLLFLGHITSVGLSSDRVDFDFVSSSAPSIPPGPAIGIGAATEALTDMNYMPNGEAGHSHDSKLLTIVFLPLALVTGVLKFFSSMWDYVFSSPRNFTESLEKMYTTPHKKNFYPQAPEPLLSPEWRKQEIIETCDNTLKRLTPKNAPKKVDAPAEIKSVKNDKVDALNKIKQTVMGNENLDDATCATLREQAKPLAENRSRFFKVATPQSAKDMTHVLDTCFPQPSA